MPVSTLASTNKSPRGLNAADAPQLPLPRPKALTISLSVPSGTRAIEDDSFPFEALSDIAEIESWRKEINRPLYHIHKWWAQRLGTVFRAMVIGAFTPAGADILDLFYRPLRIDNATVFDPFMGSGTTIGEALKLGARGIGRDINPVAHFLVNNALAIHDRRAILSTTKDDLPVPFAPASHSRPPRDPVYLPGDRG